MNRKHPVNFAPIHDWKYYAECVSRHGSAKPEMRTPEEKLKVYASYFNVIHQAKHGNVDQVALDRARWKAKLELREKMIHAFLEMDKRRDG